MNIKRKTVLRFIRKAVANLPEQTYKAFHKYNEPRIEQDEEGKNVLRIGYLGDHNVNHYRRCKKAYDTYGFAGIDAYLRLFGFQLSDQQV